jgi:hypothetical protein
MSDTDAITLRSLQVCGSAMSQHICGCDCWLIIQSNMPLTSAKGLYDRIPKKTPAYVQASAQPTCVCSTNMASHLYQVPPQDILK